MIEVAEMLATLDKLVVKDLGLVIVALDVTLVLSCVEVNVTAETKLLRLVSEDCEVVNDDVDKLGAKLVEEFASTFAKLATVSA